MYSLSWNREENVSTEEVLYVVATNEPLTGFVLQDEDEDEDLDDEDDLDDEALDDEDLDDDDDEDEDDEEED